MQNYDKRWKTCWAAAPDIYQLLKESKTLEAARRKIMNYLEAAEIEFRNDYFEISSWDYIILKDAIIVLKNVFSRKNEAISKFSPLKALWEASRKGDSDVRYGFIDEFEHLFRAIKGHARVYPSQLTEGLVSPYYERYKGREAAIKRSDFLDALGENIDSYIERYPNGLEPEIQEKRAENKKKILEVFGGTDEDWQNYTWHYRNVIKNKAGIEKLKKIIQLPKEEETSILLAITNKIPFGLTPHYLHLMDVEPNSNDYAVRRQVFPPLNYVKSMIEHKKDRNLAFDFMRERDTSPTDHITRRYAKVAILKPIDTCPQICVYCQRNWEIVSPFDKSAVVPEKEIDKAIKWLNKHRQIMDLLVTGGDPLIMGNQWLDKLLAKLSQIPHLKSIRIASRTPVTAPQRIDQDLLDILAKYNIPGKRFIYLVTHFSHPYEICTENMEKIDQLRKRGINVYNQQVFTFSNSRRFETVALRIGMKMLGVDPYYVFNMKGKSEISEYAVPIARLLQEVKEEARLLPGIYRSDEPVFNVPFLGKNHMRARQDHQLISILSDGRRVYVFHPWEKNIRGVESYVYFDVSISDYLKNLYEMGEDVDEYRSIWYYY